MYLSTLFCTGIWRGNLKEGDRLEDPGVDKREILKWIFKVWDAAWFGLICVRIERVYGLAVNAVMNLPFPQNSAKILTS
jgi:hypothetical protein